MNWRRGVDYYDEGDLLWLEVATIIHRETQGQKSIDDFCHLFHGGTNSGPEVKTYTLDQLVQALNQIAPYDWAGFLHERLTSTSAEAPVGGIENGGWKVTYTGEPLKLQGRRANVSEAYSIGLNVGDDGGVIDSIVGSAAYNAGISAGMKVVGVNGRVFTRDLLKDAIDASKKGSAPITLLVVDDDYFKTCTIDYHGGQKFPHLARDESKADYLDDLVKARAGNQ